MTLNELSTEEISDEADCCRDLYAAMFDQLRSDLHRKLDLARSETHRRSGAKLDISTRRHRSNELINMRRRQANAYLMSDDFEYVCSLLDLDPRKVEKALRAPRSKRLSNLKQYRFGRWDRKERPDG
jgi:hypothetical protein